MGNRPINRRPWRRAPWRSRGKRREVRWLDGNSSQYATDPIISSSIITSGAASTPLVVAYGDTDWEYSDRSEVTIDRILGSIGFFVASSNNSSLAPSPLILRFGILAVEDTENTYPTINLFDNESLEEFEWMWLHNQMTPGYGSASSLELQQASLWMHHTVTIPVDVRTRRKLGKKDGIALYAQYAAAFENTPNDVQLVRMNQQLRLIVMS